MFIFAINIKTINNYKNNIKDKTYYNYNKKSCFIKNYLNKKNYIIKLMIVLATSIPTIKIKKKSFKTNFIY